jgi:hypothetical protein
VAALATTDADNSWYSNRKQVRDHWSRLCPQLYGCGSKHLRAANDKATRTTHVALPALYIEMVRAINLQDHTPPIIERPLCVEIAQPSMRVQALDLSIRLLNAKAATDSN